MSNVKHTDFERILNEALESKGQIGLPNVKLIEDPTEALLRIATSSSRYWAHKAYRMKTVDYDPPLGGRQTHEIAYYPKVFTEHGGMHGGFMGSGTILHATGGVPKVYSFFMCDHEWNESGANHMRGWHPRRCNKCGFDASIDSGD